MAGPARALRPFDVLRQGAIVASMIAAIVLLHRFAVPGDAFDPRGLLALGFLVIAAYTVGELAGMVRLPRITGYLLAGILFGPSIALLLQGIVPERWLVAPLQDGIVSERVVGQLAPVDALALALIALTAGGELKWDELRRGAAAIVGMVGAMIASVVPAATVLLVVLAIAVPGSVTALEGLTGAPFLLVAVAMAVLAAATAPGDAIGVITTTGARGPVSSAVLASVVAGEISVVLLFSAVSGAVFAELGIAGDVSVVETLAAVGLSVGLGVAVGGAIALYLRYVAVDVLLFLVGLVYATTFVLQEFRGETALMFIAAGFVVGNLTRQGEALIREVELLTKPVYVVFFALAGAKLNLDIMGLLLPAVGLFTVRLVAVYVAVRAGARLAGAPEVVTRHAWTGFLSQAGMAIALATQARAVLPGAVGDGVYSLVIALITLNELVGATVLQSGLRRAGEIPGASPDGAGEGVVDRDPDAEVTVVQPAPRTGSPELDEALDALEVRVRGAARQQSEAPLSEIARTGEARLRLLRRELLRTVRRVPARPLAGPDLAAALRTDLGDLMDAWCDVVRDASAEPRWSPMAVVDAVDGALAGLPRSVVVPVPDAVLEPRPEPVPRRVRRWALRLGNRWVGARREVALRDLARYHLSGLLPGRLEPLAALLVAIDERTALRVAAIAVTVGRGFEACARLAASDAGEDAVRAELGRVQAEAEAAFQQALGHLAGDVAAAEERLAGVVGSALHRVRTDARAIGTLDLPHRARRYGRVFRERNRAIGLLSTRFPEVRRRLAARFALLGVELAIVGLAGRAQEAVQAHGDGLARKVRGRAVLQLRGVDAAVAEWLDRVRAALEGTATGAELAQVLKDGGDALLHRVREAQATVGALDGELADEGWVGGLTDAVLHAAQDLPESAVVPTGPVAPSDRVLAPPVATTEIAVRELVTALVEARVSRELHEVTAAIEKDVHEVAHALADLERVVSFNVGLAVAEIEGLGAAIPPLETVDLVRAMAAGAIGRTHHRLGRVAEAAEAGTAGLEERVRQAVIGQLDELRLSIVGGRAADLRAMWLVEGRLRLSRRAVAWQGLVPELRDRAGGWLQRALGADRVHGLRATLGLREDADPVDLRALLAPPGPRVDVPVVYRRLFADVPFEAGDLLAGRQDDLRRLRAALAPGSRLRSAAVVGLDAHAARALVTAAVRGSAGDVVWLDASRPCGSETVDAWLARIEGRSNQAVVLGDLRWLFRRRPGGMAPLDRLVRAVLDDGGRNAFVWIADLAVWRHVARATGLEAATAAVVELGALTVDELEQAVISRHAMSGYDVTFDGESDLAWQLHHAVLRGEDADRRRKAWFRTLHRASGGVLQDALGLWLASLREVDEAQERVRIGPVLQPPLARLAELPDDALVTLLETGRQGWTSAEQHARLFRETLAAAEAWLAGLGHLGLLTPGEEGTWRIATHLRGPVHRVLAERGWT